VCTIALLHRVRTDAPLVIAANRDEVYARPATGPVVLDPERGVVGGRDHRGGTWMGVTRAGLFVGLTNQRTREAPAPDAPSRGEVVLRALREGSLRSALASLRRCDPSRYPPFNLALGDGARLVLAYARPSGWEWVELGPGVHVLANDRLGSPWFPKAARLGAMIEPVSGLPWPALRARLARALGDTEVPETFEPDVDFAEDPDFARALQAICVRTAGYGTRSATIAALGDGRVREYRFAPGPPDRVAFEDFTGLLG
jgi:uncharacterized protein with NRDE domain